MKKKRKRQLFPFRRSMRQRFNVQFKQLTRQLSFIYSTKIFFYFIFISVLMIVAMGRRDSNTINNCYILHLMAHWGGVNGAQRSGCDTSEFQKRLSLNCFFYSIYYRRWKSAT